MADVAVLAGVSAKTVSNVLLGRPDVAETTRAAVLRAVEAVGYRMNTAASGLASGRTGRVAVVVPNLHQPYFAEIAERLIVALGERGLRTWLRVAHDERAERAATVGAGTREVDGVIVCPYHFGPGMLAGALPQRPVVQLGGAPNPLVDTVVMGEFEGARAMTQHLLDTGRRRIAVVWNGPPGGDRFDGHLAALAAHGIAPDDRLVVSGDDWDRRATGFEAVTRLLRARTPFDAALCVNDAMAVGAMAAMRRHGIRIPEDVAVTGFDATDEGEFTVPGLTSVSPQQELMVEAAVGMLVDRTGGYDGAAREVRTGADVVVRGSTSPRP